MRIGLIAPPWLPVPPPAYGGTEVVVDNLARGLQALGHEVVLFTVGDSTCPVPRQYLYRSAVAPMGAGVKEAATSWPRTRRSPAWMSFMTTACSAHCWPAAGGCVTRRSW